VSYDVVVIGGGINGAGIARDASGRGARVLLVEAADLGGATSSASSKLIHGGLRYLEHYEFRLVAEALAEREVLLRVARHLVQPMHFIMPHVPTLRPRWMIRAGLFLYDHLKRRSILPGSQAIRLDVAPYRDVLRPELRHGFRYSDCRVDDARLVIANALDAARRGARILPRTECVSAHRKAGGWRVLLSNGEAVEARVLVNAAGPWVKRVLNERVGQPSRDDVRLVKGSHVVVPRCYAGEEAFILQNDDRRVIFLIPFEERFTLVGTTEVPHEADPSRPQASEAEIEYLCKSATRYLARPVSARDVLWSYAGVRPLYDDGSHDPSSITRDYTLRLDAASGEAPVLSVFGGKLTTYRTLAEQALRKLAPYLAQKRPWTAGAPLPGSDMPPHEEALASLRGRYPRLAPLVLKGVLRRHGALAEEVLGDGMVGEDLGAGLTEREVRYFMEREWASSAEDVLWRRSKVGLHLSRPQCERVAELIGR
jgi:glycerol-3-phosphate dehydrogenase